MSAVSPGLASVTAKAKDKDLLVQCDVTVTGKPVKSIKLNKTSLSLQEGSSEQLKVTIDPQDATNQTIKYTSNNKIATVDSNGLVKGISKGSALITASSADGGFVSECKVNVNAKPEKLNQLLYHTNQQNLHQPQKDPTFYSQRKVVI